MIQLRLPTSVQDRAYSNLIVELLETSQKIQEHPLNMQNYFIDYHTILKPKSTLELGTSLGIATHAMALGYSKNTITSIEGCPKTVVYAKQQLNRFKTHKIAIETGIFINLLPHLKECSYDLISFNGHHDKDATIQYFETLLPKAHNESIFIFHDIYWSKGMTEAWEYIKSHTAVTVTVDCFYLGFVFFRKEQVKEHFKIRV